MNYQMPFGMPNNNMLPNSSMMPGMPAMPNDNNGQSLENKINNLEKRVLIIEKKLGISSNYDDGYLPYQSSMHMM